MKNLVVIFCVLFSGQAFAVDALNFNCNVGSQNIKTLPGLRLVPDNPVVRLHIKVIKNQTRLFVVPAETKSGQTTTPMNLVVSDWVAPDNVSSEGSDLLGLLSFFFSVDVGNIARMRASIPSDILSDFAYLEIEYKNGKVLKLGFDGTTPDECV